uniref:Fibronectin type-III domain-containing protein n=1 Tax=Candidatus Methanophagaceae archaeon ANME-1 ERB6 TaxID=2759912 RepID=A0A7G9YZG0_9EURY|nr:hypothetical protein JNHLJEBA_00004 [Methanosarcinales archaeon ANME-1 ERB6]
MSKIKANNDRNILKKVIGGFFVGILLASVLIGILTVIPEKVRAETWSIETVDATGDVGFSSIALDSNNNPHIGYTDLTNKDLKYAKWTGTTWSITTIGDVGISNSIALDSNNNPHISYVGYRDLKYAKWTGTTWSTTTVDSAFAETGGQASMALDSNNYPHISYYNGTNKDLKYAKWTGTTWGITTVDSAGVGAFSSIALDSNNNPHISYFDDTNEDLKYAKWTGSAWSITTVDSTGDVGILNSIALDSNNNPHISYSDYTNFDLKYAKWTGSAWSIKTVDSAGDVGYFTAIALDSNNNPHIGYFDYTNFDLKYAKWTGTAWSITTVDSTGDVGMFSSIALDSNGYPHISYGDYTNKDLKYAKLAPTVPSPPQNLQSTVSDGYVNLSWSAPSDDGGSAITNYLIYRGTTSEGETLLTTVGNVTTYNDTTVDSGQTFFYKVRAKNVAGEGPLSDEASATTPTPSPSPEVSPPPKPIVTTPSAPQNLQATAGDRYVNLSWSAPSDDGGSTLTKYMIYRGTSSGGEGPHAFVSAPTTSYNDTAVTNNQTYYYQVSAVNEVGEGVKSNEASATPKRGVTMPSAPQKLRATAGDGYVNLSWSAPSDDGGSAITEYKIYRGTSPGGESPHAFVSANTTSYNDTAVTNNQTYYYQVSAVNLAGEGAKPEEASAIPISVAPPTPPHPWWKSWLVPILIVIAVVVIAIAAILIYKKRGKRGEVREEKREEAKEEKKRFCMHCGASIPIGAKFCPNCGEEPIKGGGEVKVCKNCDSAIPTEAKFCSVCGAAQPID